MQVQRRQALKKAILHFIIRVPQGIAHPSLIIVDYGKIPRLVKERYRVRVVRTVIRQGTSVGIDPASRELLRIEIYLHQLIQKERRRPRGEPVRSKLLFLQSID